ncbi:MAG: hypothetical protein HYY19_01660 [Candidatus Rokubacteria bacterium]|nr:hypothetical protein [Candidatus Rokubacteria bacterium]
MTRRAGAILLAGLLVMAGAAAAVGLRLREAGPLVLTALERRLPGEVRATRTHLALWPPLRLTLDGLTAALPGAPAPYLEARRLVVAIDPFPLLAGRLAAGTVRLLEPRLVLRLEDGWWGGTASRPRPGAPPTREGRGEPGRPGPAPALPAAIAVEGGRLELAGGGRSAVLDGIAGAVTRAPEGLWVAGEIASPPVRFVGRLEPLTATLEAEGTVRDLRSGPLALDGPFSLVVRPAGRSTLEARLDFTPAELALPGFVKRRGEPGLLTASLQSERGLLVRPLIVRLGPVEIEAEATLAPDRLTLSARTDRFPLDRLSLEVQGRTVEVGGEVTGAVGVEVRGLMAPEFRGRLAVSDASLRLPGGPLPLITVRRGELRLEGRRRGAAPFRLVGALEARTGRWGGVPFDGLVVRLAADARRWALSRIALRAAGGETVGSATLDPTTREGRLRLSGAHLTLGPLLRLTAGDWPGRGGGLVRGELALRWRGLSWPELLETARGHGVLALEHGWLRVPASDRLGGRTVTVEELRVPYEVRGTTLTIRGLRGRGPTWELSGRGRVELGGELEVRLHGRRRDEPLEGLLGGSLSRPRLLVLRGGF